MFVAIPLSPLPQGARALSATVHRAATRPLRHCHLTISNSHTRSRGALRPGYEAFSPTPRGGRSADRRSGAAAPVGPAASDAHRRFWRGRPGTQRGALRPMTRDARLSALHRGGFGPGSALPFPAFPPGPCSEAPRGRVVVLGGRGPGPFEDNGHEPQPRNATPPSVFRIVSRKRPSSSEDDASLAVAK